MTTGKDFTAGTKYPFMRMPKMNLTTSDFDEKCDDLEDCIHQVHHFFMWYGDRKKGHRDEVRSIIFLEGLFLHMLVVIHVIYQMRGKKLYDERISRFKDILVELNEQMHLGTKYIRISNKCLEDELNNECSCVAAMRQDVVEGFRSLAGWMKEVTRDARYREQAESLTDELGLNYSMKMFGCVGDNFEQHANMVMNGLMMLACPSMKDEEPDTYRKMFDATIDDFQSGYSWKSSFDSWKRKIDKAYDILGITTDEYKMVYLKKFWAALDDREQELVERFGIEHVNARYDSERMAMGFRIYEHLNNNDDEESPRMQPEDLHQYLLYVVQKKWIDEEIDRLRPPHGKPPVGPKKRQLFKQNVNIALLIDCLNEVYCRFFVEDENQVFLKGKHKDTIMLMAYLFIICESEDYFVNSDRVPFYTFCTSKAGFVTDKSNRTFRNRIDMLEDVYRYYCLHKSQKPEKEADDDYRIVLRIFHGTKKYEEFRKKMNG